MTFETALSFNRVCYPCSPSRFPFAIRCSKSLNNKFSRIVDLSDKKKIIRLCLTHSHLNVEVTS